MSRKASLSLGLIVRFRVTDKRIQKSNRALLDASFQVLLLNPHASLSEIASQAGVGRATLYRHFPSRDDLLTAIAVESLQLVKSAISPVMIGDLHGVTAIHKVIESLLPLADRFHFLQMVWTLVEFDQQVLKLYEEQMNVIKKMIIQGQEKGELNPELTPDWIVSVLDSMLYSASWMLANDMMSKTQIEQQLIQTLLKGIQSNEV